MICNHMTHKFHAYNVQHDVITVSQPEVRSPQHDSGNHCLRLSYLHHERHDEGLYATSAYVMPAHPMSW